MEKIQFDSKVNLSQRAETGNKRSELEKSHRQNQESEKRFCLQRESCDKEKEDTMEEPKGQRRFQEEKENNTSRRIKYSKKQYLQDEGKSRIKIREDTERQQTLQTWSRDICLLFLNSFDRNDRKEELE
jgi:DNA polymerase II small subunit/DNA polymerase delta subunit B